MVGPMRRAASPPTKYSDAVAKRICERIAGGESLRTICRDADMPGKANVLAWLAKDTHPGFREAYIAARNAQADSLFDEIVDIAATATDRDSAAAARVQIDARKWVAGKLRPKVYGDKLDVEHSGSIDLVTKEQRDAAVAAAAKADQ